MKTKFWILTCGTALAVSFFHQSLKADESAPPAATNVFLDEGEADYEMPKVDATTDAAETKSAAKKTNSKIKEAKNPRVPANEDEDDDKSTAGTKGDAFDQMQNPEASAPALEKKQPAKVKKTQDVSKTTIEPKVLAAKLPSKNLKDIVQDAQKIATQPASPKASPTRKVASTQFTSGFKSTKDGDCVMYADADKTSTQVLVVKGSKKLWVEQNGDWYKAYHKKGSGFLPAECFE